jgi:hypothetical protein
MIKPIFLEPIGIAKSNMLLTMFSNQALPKNQVYLIKQYYDSIKFIHQRRGYPNYIYILNQQSLSPLHEISYPWSSWWLQCYSFRVRPNWVRENPYYDRKLFGPRYNGTGHGGLVFIQREGRKPARNRGSIEFSIYLFFPQWSCFIFLLNLNWSSLFY